MTFTEALLKMCGVRACVDDHAYWDNSCHQCTAAIAKRELIHEELAPKIEAALRAAYDAGYGDGTKECRAYAKNRGVTAGIEAMQ